VAGDDLRPQVPQSLLVLDPVERLVDHRDRVGKPAFGIEKLGQVKRETGSPWIALQGSTEPFLGNDRFAVSRRDQAFQIFQPRSVRDARP
jgi:hypothetical protein